MQIFYIIFFGLILAEIIKLLEPIGWVFQHILNLIFAVIVFVVLFVIAIIVINYFKYKDETEEELAERLKLEKMLDKWRKQFK